MPLARSNSKARSSALGADVVADDLGDRPHLADRERARGDALHVRLEALQPGDGLGRVAHHVAVLDQVADGVEAEAVHAHVLQPELRDAVGLGRHGGIAVIQVGHAGPEDAVVDAARSSSARPAGPRARGSAAPGRAARTGTSRGTAGRRAAPA